MLLGVKRALSSEHGGRPSPPTKLGRQTEPGRVPLLNELVTEGDLGAEGQLGIGFVGVQPPMLLDVESVGGPILAPSHYAILHVVDDIEEVMKKIKKI